MSRPEVDENSEQDFIKIILTKDQERSKRDKKQMWIRKSRCIELDRTWYCIEKFNVALNLCGILEVALYFSKDFLKTAARGLAVAKAPWLLEVTIVCFLRQESNLWSPALK